jgi:hypothetical protein
MLIHCVISHVLPTEAELNVLDTSWGPKRRKVEDLLLILARAAIQETRKQGCHFAPWSADAANATLHQILQSG